MKRIICLILIAMLSVTSYVAVSADEPIEVSVGLENYEIIVSGSLGASAANHMVTLAVMKPNAVLPDTSVNTEGFAGEITDFYMTIANRYGDYEFDQFQLYGNSGDYILQVIADNGTTPYTLTRYLPSKTQFDKIVKDISDGDVDKIYSTLETSKEELLKITDITLYYSFSETVKKAICGVIEETEKYETLGEITNDVLTQSALYEIKNTNSAQRIYDYLYLDESGFDENFKVIVKEHLNFEEKKNISVLKDFDSLDNSAKQTVLESLVQNKREDIADFYDKLEISTINYNFGHVDSWTKISTYIVKYKDDVLNSLDYKKYKNSSNKTEIDKSLVGKSFKSISALCEYINNYKTSDVPSGGGGGGGAGGSGGFGSQAGAGTGSVTTDAVASLTPVVPSVQPENNVVFADIKGYDWAEKEIEYLYKQGIINGTGKGEFSPERNVTREEFVKMLVVAAGLTEQNHYDFEDVKIDHWSYPYIMKAIAGGIVNGVTETSFGTGRFITREDMAVLAYRVLKNGSDEELTPKFMDSNDISEYAVGSIAAMAEKGIINGYSDGTFAPKALSSRAEAAVVIYRVINALNK